MPTFASSSGGSVGPRHRDSYPLKGGEQKSRLKKVRLVSTSPLTGGKVARGARGLSVLARGPTREGGAPVLVGSRFRSARLSFPPFDLWGFPRGPGFLSPLPPPY